MEQEKIVLKLTQKQFDILTTSIASKVKKCEATDVYFQLLKDINYQKVTINN